VNVHKEWKRGQGTLEVYKDLPKFDDLTRYGLTAEEECQQWETECNRLADLVEEHWRKGYTMNIADCGTDPKTSLADIATIADSLLCNLELCKFDTAMVILENQPFMKNETGSKESTLFSSVTENAKASSDVLLKRYVGSDNLEARPPSELDSGINEVRLYNDFIDYMTGSLAMLWAKSAKGSAWDSCCLSILAKTAAKLKQIRQDARNHAEFSLAGSKYHDLVKTSQSPSGLGTSTVVAQGLPQRYFKVQNTIRLYMSAILKQVLEAFQPSLSQGSEPYAFKLDTMIYQGGLSVTHQVLSGNRKGRYSASTNPIDLHMAYHGCKLLRAILTDIPSHRVSSRETRSEAPLPPDTSIDRFQTVRSGQIRWQWEETAHRIGEKPNVPGDENLPLSVSKGSMQSLHGLDDLISVVTFSTLSSSFVSTYMRRAYLYLATTTRIEDGMGLTVAPIDHLFSAAFHLDTGSDGQPALDDGDVFALLSAYNPANPIVNRRSDTSEFPPMQRLRGHFYGRSRDSGSSRGTDIEKNIVGPPHKSTRITSHASMKQEYESQLSTMLRWKVTDTSVIVSQRLYVSMTALLFVIALSAGVAMIGTLNGAIPDVDISNVVMAVWTIGGFCVVLAKSWSVKDWSWHDFIHFRLTCESVQQLSTATGINPQVIITFLLKQAEQQAFFTSGPYNTFFGERRESAAFAIDVPTKLSALQYCGFHFLGVALPEKDILVCIAGRKEKERTAATGSKESRLVCSVPGLLDADAPGTILHFKEQSFSWGKGYGFYINDEVSFG
jgi:hypothetical protein